MVMGTRGFAGLAGALMFALVICLLPTDGLAGGLRGAPTREAAGGQGGNDDGKFCNQTARALHRACGFQVRDDYWVARAICINESDADARQECFADAGTARQEGDELCEEQRDGRLDACRSLGQDRYDPDFDPASFDDDFTKLTNPNPYFPLTVGNRWEYHDGGTETDVVEVVDETKLIAGVTCIVVRDQVSNEHGIKEDTDDWYAQAKDGNTWYCGEEVKDFESFDGDKPMRPELVSIDGSFKAGREGDKPGIIFLATPKRGDVYVEEASLGNAEDVTEVLSTTYAFGEDEDLDKSVPKDLAELLCSGDCVVTRNFSLLEPGISARKYYAPGIGVFLEVESEGQVIRLVSCNFDSRCAKLRR